jgi:hypothetical protein
MRRTVIALACLLPMAAAAQQQQQQPPAQQAPQAPIFNLTDEQVRAVMQVARDNLAGA